MRKNRRTSWMRVFSGSAADRRRLLMAGLGLGVILTFAVGVRPAEQSGAELRGKANKLHADGNYKESLELFQRLLLEIRDDPKQAPRDLEMAVSCLPSLNRVNEFDAFVEGVIGANKENWRLLFAAAQQYLNGQHDGFIIAGEFRRGPHRGGGRGVDAFERDHVRALQLMTLAKEKLSGEEPDPERGNFHREFAGMFLRGRHSNRDAWRLQYLTDLGQLPDYEEGGRYYGGGARGAPVDAEGNPVYHYLPKSYEEAKSDGERWRWLLMESMEVYPADADRIRYDFADFMHEQFGVQTMADYGRFWGGGEDEGSKDESGAYALHTLAEDETIARLATGIKRFRLPDEFNFIKIWRRMAEDEQNSLNVSACECLVSACERLAQLFENRRQYEKAADFWRRVVAKSSGRQKENAQARLDQIVKNWGCFEPVMAQPAERGATVDYRFRNGARVDFEAYEIDVRTLLDDVKNYIKSRPSQMDGEKIDIGNIGYRLVRRNEAKYLGKRVAEWALDLEPRPRHFDKRITVATPLQKAGAYLLIAKMKDGNTSRIVIWLNDTAIVKKPLDGKTFYFVADARTGKPAPKTNVEFFGYRHERIQTGAVWTKDYRTLIAQFAEYTDADGQVIPDPKDQPADYQWIIIATNDEGRFAYLGFTGVWYPTYYDREYNETKVFTITDRPVYRPGQPVKFKFWVRHAKYDQEDASSFANQSFTVRIQDPKGDKILENTFTADAYGGFDGEYELPKDATLGVYSIHIPDQGGGTFRVEEYKKPEFEVTVEAPDEPVMLGEKITAKIQAKYYFGEFVRKGKVKYKVLRSDYSANWYPVGAWDWFYGPGYWWFACDYDWYPGWGRWGCVRPVPWWWGRSSPQPELVMENEVEVGEEGAVDVEIDTALAKEIHGDVDHRYEITAEVTDESRRTIVGKGQVLVARKPFKVYAWVDRGHYRVGDTIRASFSAQTLDNKPVQGKGVLNLYKIAYREDEKGELKPVETSAQEWKLDADEEGRASVQMKASETGQYRLSYRLTDAKGHEIEGGYVLTIAGEGFDGAEFRFNDIELVTDKREYAPGEKARLQINTNRVGGTVVLFTRPANGVYLPPKVIRLAGKSAIEEIEVSKKDMPNFFVEAVTIADGRIHTETREIVVPPEKRILNLEIEPSAQEYKPGEKAKIRLRLTDSDAKPFVGSAVVTVYDKALEYISGGSNVPEIKAFFWKWRRGHNPQSESNLECWFRNELKEGEVDMGDLGVFGRSVAGDMEVIEGVRAYGDRLGAGPARMARGLGETRASPMEAAGEVKALAMAPAAAPAGASEEVAKAADFAQGEAPGAPEIQPTIRTQFADSAFWAASLTTDEAGRAEIELTMPDNLTGWKVKSWAMGHGTKVAEAETTIVTKKNLMLRLQAPRFFVEKDEVVLSANVHNYLKDKKQVRVVLELEGGCLEATDELERRIAIGADGEERVDWRVKVVKEGEAVVRMKALTDEESDAMEMRFPVYVHGMDKMVAFSGYIRPDKETATITIDVPKERRIDESRLEVRYSPTLAGAMVDALPYLVAYPYGCTEQALSRFLPTVITQRILLQMGLDLKEIRDKRTNLNAQEIGDDRERAQQWRRDLHPDDAFWNPVFDEAEVERMVKEGVKALTEMQLSDGGWGWFSGYGEHSWPHTTAYVVHGLQIARENDVAIAPGVIEQGVEWLKRYQEEQVRRLKNWPQEKDPRKQFADNLDAFVYMVLADADVADDAMREFLYRDRNHLAVYAKAMFGIALHKQIPIAGAQASVRTDTRAAQLIEQRDMMIRNIEQFLVRDDENQTAYLNLGNDGYWWCWYGSEYEAHAYYLKLLSKTGQANDWKAPYLVKYLLNNRKHATYWNSTRDTAVCIEAFADYLKATEEHKPDMTVEIFVDGKKQKEVRIAPENLFAFDNRFVMFGDAVESGEHTIELRKKGTGPLYFNAYLSYFSLEDFITRAGLEVKVDRDVYKLTRVDKSVKVAGSRGQAVDQKVEKYERAKLKSDDALKSGDLVEIELVIESKNDYEYLVFEDMKAAGFEPVEVRSGYNGNDMGAYVEFRDNRVVFFARSLARGRHSVSYRMRAEIPGRFSALPARGCAMYAPELRGNSDEIKLRIED